MPADMNDYFKKRNFEQKNGNNGGNTPPPNRPNGNNNSNNGMNFLEDFKKPIIIGLGVLVGIVLFKPFVIINSGEVGIKVTNGKYNDEPLYAGLHFFIPVIEKVIPVNTKVRLIIYSDKESSATGENLNAGTYSSRASDGDGSVQMNPAIGVLDKRGLTVNIDLAVQYQLKPENTPKTIERWGASWEEKIINSKVREVVRDVVGQYTAEQLPEMRNEIAKSIQAKLVAKVDTLKDSPVSLSSVELRNINLPQKIKDQIERVQIAKQDVTIAEQQKEKAKQMADKITIEATAQANANKVIGESLNAQLIQLEQIKNQGKFNEALKENKNAQIFLTPNGAVPNIWVDMKNQNQKQQLTTQQQ
jgi:regulator of protease activity HflC (stomatin/prohibitin superfamily)